MTEDDSWIQESLALALQQEKARIRCEDCKGRGVYKLGVEYTTCIICFGEGRYLPVEESNE